MFAELEEASIENKSFRGVVWLGREGGFDEGDAVRLAEPSVCNAGFVDIFENVGAVELQRSAKESAIVVGAVRSASGR